MDRYFKKVITKHNALAAVSVRIMASGAFVNVNSNSIALKDDGQNLVQNHVHDWVLPEYN